MLKTISIIGAGAVGRSIALALFYNRMPVSGIYSENGRTAAVLARRVGSKRFRTVRDAVQTSSVILIAVPDDRISEVVRSIKENTRTDQLKGRTILHTSGTLTSDVLSPLKKLGASIGSIHPLQSFSSRRTVTATEGIWFTGEGDARAVAVSKSIARSIRAGYFPIRKKDKTTYHIAAVFASNYQVTIFSVVEQLALLSGIPRTKIWKMFGPLITQTTTNVLSESPAAALTGPIARGDYKTVKKHQITLASSKRLRHLTPLYDALRRETERLANKQPYAR